MLVEINLLPKKESKNVALFVILGTLLLILLISGFVIYWLGHSYNQKITGIEEQIDSTQQIVAIEQQKMVEYEQSNSVTELEKSVAWAKEYPIKTVPVLQKLTSLLPERGFVQTFTYEETGTIHLSVQFDTSREAAYYLKSLIDSKWIKEAKLASLTTGEWKTEPNEEVITDMINSRFAPRYLGEYELILNKVSIKDEEEKENESPKQGGEDS